MKYVLVHKSKFNFVYCEDCGNYMSEIVCSVCGGSGESDENVFQCWKFCPNCGAKMKGGAE